jgi:alcohol dehydrogenase class IV
LFGFAARTVLLGFAARFVLSPVWFCPMFESLLSPDSPAADMRLPGRIIFGWGTRSTLPRQVSDWGRHAAFVVGSRGLEEQGVLAEMTRGLHAAAIQTTVLPRQSGEPTVADVDAAANAVRALGPLNDVVMVGLGGGSAIDLAKAVAAVAVDPQARSCSAFLEGERPPSPLIARPLPVIAVPTTAGTGAEATRNAVVSLSQPRVKRSLRSDALMPVAALIDPELTVSCPAAVTAASGMDAITQLIEAWFSRRSSSTVRDLSLRAMVGTRDALLALIHSPNDRSARERMSASAFLSGVALTNGGLGLAHGVAAALGARFNTPHGVACAVMLPAAVEFNLARTAIDPTPVCQALGLPPSPSADRPEISKRLVDSLSELLQRLGLPRRLRDLGVSRSDLPALAAGSRGNSLAGNPVDVSDADLVAVLESRL